MKKFILMLMVVFAGLTANAQRTPHAFGAHFGGSTIDLEYQYHFSKKNFLDVTAGVFDLDDGFALQAVYNWNIKQWSNWTPRFGTLEVLGRFWWRHWFLRLLRPPRRHVLWSGGYARLWFHAESRAADLWFRLSPDGSLQRRRRFQHHRPRFSQHWCNPHLPLLSNLLYFT